MKKFHYFTVFLLVVFSGCGNFRSPVEVNGNPTGFSMSYVSYLDIPGISEDEIRAIEELQRQTDFFVYGMNPSTEAFEEYGEIRGFSALFCEWLTNIFGIRFVPAIFEWDVLITGLENHTIDFTSELTPTNERKEIYFMTSPIANRSIEYVQITGSVSLHNIRISRTPRYAFLDGSITMDYVEAFTQYSFDHVFADNYEEAYNLLINGQADAFFDDSSMEAAFDLYDNITYNDFIPVIGIPVSLSTQNPSLEPIISVVQKALQNNAGDYLKELYRLGRQEHIRHRLYIKLDKEELDFLRSAVEIPYAAEYFNYPISFYNKYDKQWQGIYIDIIEEMTQLTGLQFKLVNSEKDDFPVLLDKLEKGEAYLLSELLQIDERKERFHWPATPTLSNNYALLSKTETPNVSINEVLNMRVGVQSSTAYADMFYAWFPLHTNVVEYEGSTDALIALGKGEVDLVISSQIHLLALTNYYELSGYKANLIFVHAAESYIGFNADQAVLCSIIDKAFTLIDINGISSRWASITFDYQARLLQAQRPWLIGAIVLALMVVALMSVLFVRSRSARKDLDSLVKKRTAELEIAIQAANSANKSKSSFLANMSHEIRTPMNTILGVTEIMMQNESLSEETGEALNKLYSSCDMLMGIINDILDFSKIEAGKLDIKPAQYYAASLINDSTQLNMMRIGDKPIEFQIKIDENIPAKLIGDELRIKQILNNLLSNAFKYTDTGKVVLSVYTHPGGSGQPDGQCDGEVMLNISVKDTGHGMTSGQVERLFDEYSRFNDEFNHTIEGTGLGLSITQRLINLMQGTIHVESKPDEGTLFSICLPQGAVDSEVLGKELAERLQQFRLNDIKYNKKGRIVREAMPYGKILVVDDVEANLYVAEGLMKPYKLQIDTAMSGYTAIDKIKEGYEYDIIFMDHMMPGMDGIETVKHLRNFGYKPPIVALTANAVAGQADIFLQNGFDDFISKPIDVRQLNSILNKLVRSKQPPEVIEAARKQTGAVEKSGGKTVLNKKIAGMDIAKGLEKFNGDTEAYLKVLRAYTTSIGSLFGLLEKDDNEPLAGEALIEYQRAVHSIKGTSLDIYAEPVGKKAKELEEAAKAKNLTFIEQENLSFIESVKKLIYDIEDMLSAVDAKNTKPKKDKIDSGLLSKLTGFCEEYDMDGVDTVMAEIEKYQYESDESLSAWLRKNVDVINFDSIAEKLSEYKK
ncbi:MAG: transporter substrate-binding domain-containing protein [Leptospirales bacterium]|nr:transporter substrate-binding domain-containing protein [Leptospirales bacterium]